MPLVEDEGPTTPCKPMFSATLALRGDVLRLQPFRALFYLELHSLPFIECLVSVRLNRRKVHEHIFTRLALNESITLGGVKPLYRSLLFAHGKFPCAEFALSSGVSEPAAGLPDRGIGEAGGKPRS